MYNLKPSAKADQLQDSTYQSFADAPGEHLDVQRIETQLVSLDDATQDVVELVDREIAHHDPRGSAAGCNVFSARWGD